MVKGQDTGSGVNKVETTAGVWQQSGLTCSAAYNFQHTQNPHLHAQIRERRGPQGTQAIATVKTALWTTKWLTTVFPWPVQIHFPLQYLNQLKHEKHQIKASYNLLNYINKMYTHDYFIYNKSGKRGLRLSINRFVQLNHH